MGISADELEQRAYMKFDDVDVFDDQEIIGMPLFYLVDQLGARGYCSDLSPIDAQVIVESQCRCDCEHPSFPVGMRRGESYRAFAICGSCYRVVFEL